MKVFPRWLSGKESTCQAGDVGSNLGREDPLEKEMVNHSSILAWKIMDRGTWQAFFATMVAKKC